MYVRGTVVAMCTYMNMPPRHTGISPRNQAGQKQKRLEVLEIKHKRSAAVNEQTLLCRLKGKSRLISPARTVKCNTGDCT